MYTEIHGETEFFKLVFLFNGFIKMYKLDSTKQLQITAVTLTQLFKKNKKTRI